METNKTTRGDILKIDPRNVVIVDGFNSRRDFDLDGLTAQIKAQGVLNPISVIPFKDTESGEEKYRLVDGERRVRATLAAIADGAEIMRIPAIAVSKGKKDADLFVEQLMRNEGKRFSDYENGIAYAKLRDNFGFTTLEIAQKVFNKDTQVAYVSKCLSLLDLPDEVQEKLANGEISSTAVCEIARVVKDEAEQVAEVNNAVNTAKEKGKKKATSKDIVSENVKVQTDSMAICKGIGLLISYMEKYQGDGGEVTLDLMEIFAQLKEKKTITEIFELQKKAYQNAV